MGTIPNDIFRVAADIVIKTQKAGNDPDHELYLDISAALQAERDRATAAERKRCAEIARAHLALIPGHDPDAPMADEVAQGYGNAALNIATAITGKALGK